MSDEAPEIEIVQIDDSSDLPPGLSPEQATRCWLLAITNQEPKETWTAYIARLDAVFGWLWGGDLPQPPAAREMKVVK